MRTQSKTARSMVASVHSLTAVWIALMGMIGATTAAEATVQGRVVDPDGEPIEGARIVQLDEPEENTTVDDAEPVLSDADGSFSLPGVERPVRLRIEHSRFLPLEVLLAAGGDTTTWTLSPRQGFYEEVVVTAGRERARGAEPVSVAVSYIEPSDRPAANPTVVELAQGVPGVAESGQGGHFQAYSIRGVSGQRVQTLVAGARIVTERRAGATASFIDPLLLSQVDVVRGPYSSYYGSSALGGVLQALPQHFRAPVVAVGYETEGNARYARVGGGGATWSLGLAYRQAGDATTPDDLELFNRYEQWSATLFKEFVFESGLQGELMIVPAVGRDIGKPNTRYPARTTLYPEENHLVTRFTLSWPDSWRLDLWAHPNDLETLNLRSTSRETVDSEAFDFGLNLQRELDLSQEWVAQVGLDYFGRRGVRGTETTDDFETGEITAVRTLDGSEDEAAVYGSLRRGFQHVHLEFGGRYTWLGQRNVGAPSSDDSALAGFVGISIPIGLGFELAGNLGTGLRFPGLSERFFTGATGRGEVFANPDLEPERSVSTDVGVRWHGRRTYVAGYVFRNQISEYIEQIELDTGVSSFENLTSGTIEGVEIEGFFQVDDGLRLSWAGQTVDGRSDLDEPLADIPPDRIEADISWSPGRWLAAARWQHRFAKNDSGPGEQPVDAAEVVSATIGCDLETGLRLTIWASNLLDEVYLPSADDLAVPAAGRSIGVGISWQR